ncbi:MAG: hypothetical protein U0166_18535 [Acidobacteriota bacterium]
MRLPPTITIALLALAGAPSLAEPGGSIELYGSQETFWTTLGLRGTYALSPHWAIVGSVESSLTEQTFVAADSGALYTFDPGGRADGFAYATAGQVNGEDEGWFALDGPRATFGIGERWRLGSRAYVRADGSAFFMLDGGGNGFAVALGVGFDIGRR